jgi:hypothetical protein
MPNTVENWTDTNGPNTVQPLDTYGSRGTGFVSAESVIICAGKPAYVETEINAMIPIGLVENANIQQNKALQQLFEVGSRRPFFIPGRHQIQAAMSRVIFNGPSLMKALYMVTGGDAIENQTGGISPDDLPGFMPTTTAAGSDLTGSTGEVEHSDSLWINLASEMFNHPFGLAFLMKNMEGETYGGVFLEECFIQAHQFSIASQQTVLLENVSLRAAKVIGISAAAIGDVAGSPPVPPTVT